MNARIKSSTRAGRLLYKTLSMGLAISAILAPHAMAMTVSPTIDNGQLSVTVAQLQYPKAKLGKALKSGLPNNISLWLSLTHNGKQIQAVHLNHQITFDLWDEVYLLQSRSSTGVQSSHSVKSLEQLLQMLSSMTIDNIMPERAIATSNGYQLKAQVIVNPVQIERIKKIQAWIASSNGYSKPAGNLTQRAATISNVTANVAAKVDVGASSAGVTSSGPRFQKLFDKILEQYAQSDEIPALWHSQPIIADVKLRP